MKSKNNIGLRIETFGTRALMQIFLEDWLLKSPRFDEQIESI